MKYLSLKYIGGFLVLIATFLLLANGYAQENSEHVLLQNLRNSGIEHKDSILYELFKLTRTQDQDKAIEYSLNGLELSKTNNHPYLEAKFLNALGWLFTEKGQFDKSEEYYRFGVDLAIKNSFTDRLMFFYNNLGVLYERQSKFDLALESYFKSIDIARELNSKRDQILTLNNIGLVFYRLSEYQKAIDNLSQSIDLAIKENIDSELTYSYLNLGLCYNELNDFNKASINFQKAIDLCGKQECDQKVLADVYYGYGVSKFTNGDIQSSISSFDKSLSICKEIHYQNGESLNYYFLAKIQLKLKNVQGALNYLNRSHQVAVTIKSQFRISNNYDLYAEIYKQAGDFNKAFEYKNRYIQSKDSIFSSNVNANLNRILISEAQKESKAIIKVKEGEIAAKEQIIRQQIYLNVSAVLIILLASLLVLVLMKMNRDKKRVNAKLSEANQTIEEQNKLLDEEVIHKAKDLEKANASLLQVNAELDNFIYKTSHDIRGPLASLKGICNVALMDIKDHPMAIDYLRKLSDTADRLDRKLTRLQFVNKLNNQSLKITSINFNLLITTLKKSFEQKAKAANVQLESSIVDNIELTSDYEMLKTILENLLDNAIKFSNTSDRYASFARIIVASNKLVDGVSIRIIDNGVGIQDSIHKEIFRMFSRASERSETGGIGLYIVKTAAIKLGGRVALMKNLEGFTEFYVELPNLKI